MLKYIAGSDGHIYDYNGKRRTERENLNHYLTVLVPTDTGNYKLCYVHRLIAQQLVPNDDPRKTCIKHKNGVLYDNRPENLEWVTRTDHFTRERKKDFVPGTARPVMARDPTNGQVYMFTSKSEAAVYMKALYPELPTLPAIIYRITSAIKRNVKYCNFFWEVN